MNESINDTETEYASVEDLLSMHRTALNKKTLISEISNIVIAPGEGKNSFNFKWQILWRESISLSSS